MIAPIAYHRHPEPVHPPPRRPRRLALAALCLAACTDSLDPAWRLDSLRVVTIEGPPGLARPAPMQLRARLYSPTPLRPVHLRWRLCDPDETLDPRRCAEPAEGADLIEGFAQDIVSVAASALPSAGQRWLWVIACFDTPSTLHEGRYQCPVAPGFEAVHTIVVGRDANLSAPAIDAFTLGLDGEAPQPVDSMSTIHVGAACDRDCPALTVAVGPAAGASELGADGAREALMASFYITEGSLSRPRDVAAPGELRALTARLTPARVPGETECWVVLRDQRGGSTMRQARVYFVR